MRPKLSFTVKLAISFALFLHPPLLLAQANVEGAVFSMTNSTDPVLGNEIVMYDRLADGRLILRGLFPTGGVGSGPAPTSTVFGVPIPATADGTGSQGSLALNGNRFLFAVNAGSNSVSCFRISHSGLELLNVADSGGVFPVSLAYRAIGRGTGLLYVLNSGFDGNVTGFRVSGNCEMIRIPGSSRSLTGLINDPPFPIPVPNEVLTTPADIGFTPDGRKLVVTIKGNPDGAVVSFPLHPRSGRLERGGPTVTPFSTAGDTAGPFGFLFDDNGNLVINHGASFTVASWSLSPSGALKLLDGPVKVSGLGDASTNLRFGAFNCWIAINGDIAYVMTFGDIPATSGGRPDGPGVIVALRIGDGGELRLLPTDEFDDEGVVAVFPQDDRSNPGAALVGNHGIDLTVVNGDSGDFLYAIQPRVGQVGIWSINADGTLNDLGPTRAGLRPGADPFAGTNPGINSFLERCYLQPPGSRSPECAGGSIQGIVGF